MNFNAKGADFSKWDGGPVPYSTLDWEQYTWDFAFIKASEGIVSDPLFVRQWAAARTNTLRSTYHFFRPSIDPKLSAQRTIELMNGDLGELPLAFDLEVTDGRSDTMERAKSWLAWYEQYTGVRPIIYSSPNFLNNVVHASKYPWLSNYKLWLAQYPFDLMEPDTARDRVIHDVLYGQRVLSLPTPPAPFKVVTFHQWTARGKPEDVPGYYLGYGHKLAVDLIFYKSSYQDLLSEFSASPPAETETPPPVVIGETMIGQVLVNLNIRETPSTSRDPIGQLAPNDVVEASASFDGWWKLTKITHGTLDVPLPAADCYAYEGTTNGYIKPITEPLKTPFTLQIQGYKPYSGELEPS